MITFLRRRGLGYETCAEITRKLREDFNIEVEVLLNENIIRSRRYDTVVRWGCTSSIRHTKLINFARDIHSLCDKVGFRELMQSYNISVPKTYFSKVRMYEQEINYPLIGRERNHSQGRNMKIINNFGEIIDDNTSAYWNEFINKDKEYRIYTFFGKIIKVDEKVPTEKGKTEIAWNHHQGNSSFQNVRWGNWPLASCTEALKMNQVIPIHFSGVDVIEKNGIAYILEANSAPSITGNYGTTLYAKVFNWLNNIIEETGDRPEMSALEENITSWKQIIHPAIIQ